MAGAAAAAFAAAGVGSFFTGAISQASEAEQSLGAVESVFKGYADTVIKRSKEADRALGLSGNSYRELSTLIGSQLKNAGTPMDELGTKTDGLITQGADLAAMFGGTTADAVSAISSALKGEIDPIEKYGISMNSAALEAEAMSLGLYSGKGALDANAKSQAVMSLITKQSTDAMGTFGREADTAAGRQQRAAAQFENMKTAIGDKLLPVYSNLMDFIGTKVIPGFQTIGDVAGQVFGILFKGEDNGGPLSPGSGFMNALKTGHEWLGILKDGAKQAFDILFHGDYNGGPLGEEDSWLVDKLFDIRDAFVTLKDGAVQMFDILFRGDYHGGPLGEEDSSFVDRLFTLREGFLKVVDTVKANFMPVLAAIGGFIMERIVPALQQFGGYLRDNVLPVIQKVAGFIADNFFPALAAIAGFIVDKVLPALKVVAGFLFDNFVPIFQAVVELFMEHLYPAIFKIVNALIDFWPQLQTVATIVGVVAGAIGFLVVKLASFLIPIIGEVAGFLIDVLAGAITFVIKIIDGILTAVQWVIDAFSSMGDAADYLGKWVKLKLTELQIAVGLIFDTIRDWIVEKFTDARDLAVALAQNIWDWVSERFTKLKDATVAVWTLLRDKTVEFFTSARDLVVALAQNIWDWVSERFTKLKDAAVTIFTTLRDGVVALVTDQRDKVVNLAQNIWDWVSERFTNLKNAAVTTFTNARDLIVTVFTETRDKVVGIAQNAWDWVMERFNGLKTAASNVFTTIKDTLVATFTVLRDTVSNLAQNVWDWVVDKFTQMGTAVGTIFNGIKDAAGNIWTTIKDSFVSGINGVIDLINKFLDVVNAIAGKVGINLGLHIEKIPTVAKGGYAQGTTQGSGKTLFRADGGIVPGQSAHDRADNIPAMLTANEYVQPVSATRYYGTDAMEMIRKRQIPRELFRKYADGGLVAFGRELQSRGAKVTEHPAFGGVAMGGHGKTSLHYSGNAIDVNTRPGTSALEQKELDVLAALAKSRGFRTIWRAPDHFNHLHVDNNGGASIGGSGSGGAGIVREALGKIAQAAVDPVKAGIKAATSAHPLLGMMGGATNLAIQAVVDAITKRDEEEAAKATGGGSFEGQAAGGVQQWAGTVSKALGIMGQPQSLVQTVLRRMNQESGGNARAVNNWDVNAKRGTPSKGLMQVIDPTFRSNAMAGYNRDIFDPLSNILASMKYALGRYGSLAAAYNKSGGYANGTSLASRGVHLVGERGPELVGFRGGESVLTAPRTKAALGGAEPLIGGDLHIHVGDGSTVKDGLEETVFQLRKIKRGGGTR